MKVRFDSSKELRPDQDNGLKVLYGPSKRVAYRLRWYLILALVLSPLVYVFGRITLDLLRVEVPAQLQVPSTEIRALESGTIADVGVEVGERVEPGDLLLRLDNPDWRLRLDQLQPASADNPNGSAIPPPAFRTRPSGSRVRLCSCSRVFTARERPVRRNCCARKLI